MNKKGQIAQLQGVVTALVAVGIVLVIAFLIMGTISSNATVVADQNATAAMTQVISAADDIPGWLPIIVIVIIGALLVGLVSYFNRSSK